MPPENTGHSSSPPTRTAFVWGEPSQGTLLRAVMRAAGLCAAEVGGQGAGRAAELASVLGATGAVTHDDLRAALMRTQAEVVILGAPGEFCAGPRDADDLAAIESARSRGVRIFTFEPMPGSILQIDTPRLTSDSGDAHAGGARATLAAAGVVLGPGAEAEQAAPEVPRVGQAAALETLGAWAAPVAPMRLATPLRELREMLEGGSAGFGRIHACVIECLGAPEHGSLGARIYDAADLLNSITGAPESCFAAYAPPETRAGVRLAPSDKLRELDGTITASLSYADARAAAIVASSRAARWSRSLTLIGDAGRVRVDDHGVEWLDPRDPSRSVIPRPAGAGQRRDSSSVFGADDPAARVFGEHLSRTLEARAQPAPPTDIRAVLSITGALLLSARTGEAEEPATILRMSKGH